MDDEQGYHHCRKPSYSMILIVLLKISTLWAFAKQDTMGCTMKKMVDTCSPRSSLNFKSKLGRTWPWLKHDKHGAQMHPVDILLIWLEAVHGVWELPAIVAHLTHCLNLFQEPIKLFLPLYIPRNAVKWWRSSRTKLSCWKTLHCEHGKPFVPIAPQGFTLMGPDLHSHGSTSNPWNHSVMCHFRSSLWDPYGWKMGPKIPRNTGTWQEIGETHDMFEHILKHLTSFNIIQLKHINVSTPRTRYTVVVLCCISIPNFQVQILCDQGAWTCHCTSHRPLDRPGHPWLRRIRSPLSGGFLKSRYPNKWMLYKGNPI